MARACLCGFALLLLSSPAFAAQGVVVTPDTSLSGVVNAEFNNVAFSAWARSQGAPSFARYRVSDTTGPARLAPPILDTRNKRLYRTMIREGAARGPNFAGHFTVVAWGCGSPCIEVAIVDARTGQVYMDTVGRYAYPPLFRRDSRLLVSDPSGFMTDSLGHPEFSRVQYMEWTGRALRVVKDLDASTVRLAAALRQPSN